MAARKNKKRKRQREYEGREKRMEKGKQKRKENSEQKLAKRDEKSLGYEHAPDLTLGEINICLAKQTFYKN